MSLTEWLFERAYPGARSLGMPPLDGTLQFYAKVNQLLPPNATVLDYGAGRGAEIERSGGWRRALLLLHPHCTQRIGCDVDPVVQQNPFLDQALVLKRDAKYRIPIDDNCVDLVLADWVLEHLEDPRAAFLEMLRVLRPGSWLCARTSNASHYAYVVARLAGNTRLGLRLLNIAQPRRAERDIFPKFYRSNTARRCARLLRGAGFHKLVIVPWEAEPAYAQFHPLALIAGIAYQRLAAWDLVPKVSLQVFAQKAP